MERSDIVSTLLNFLDLVHCGKKDVLRLSLQTYSSNSLDFVDCVLYAYNIIDNSEIATFDKKLLHLLKNKI